MMLKNVIESKKNYDSSTKNRYLKIQSRDEQTMA